MIRKEKKRKKNTVHIWSALKASKDERLEVFWTCYRIVEWMGLQIRISPSLQESKPLQEPTKNPAHSCFDVVTHGWSCRVIGDTRMSKSTE